MTVDILEEDARWSEAGLAEAAEAAFGAALTYLKMPVDQFEAVVMGCDDARIAELNADFRGKPQPTNVLSWPADQINLPLGQMPPLPQPDPNGPPHELGDIAIAYETCAHEAREQDKPFDDHVRHLLVHGLLHLLGFDHINDADAEVMEGLERRILATIGVPDPY